MIIVTGTKRSGTSMWMQILTAAGLPAFGEEFPRQWETTLKGANPDGFYESALRRGIYYKTNPHPRTGAYFFPKQVEKHAVKVFIPGVVRSDRAYIGKVIATVRHWKEYEASLNRLYEMEDEAKRKAGKDPDPPARMPAILEWWSENLLLLRDILTRRYPVHVQSYDSLLDDHDKVIRDTIDWLGVGDADKAIKAVKPRNRTQNRPESTTEFDQDVIDAFDLYYNTVHERKPMTKQLVQVFNKALGKVTPQLREARNAMFEDAMRRRKANKPIDPTQADQLEDLPQI